MFIAHAPAGYLATKWVLHHHSKRTAKSPTFFLALGMLASLFPDIDMIYFYVIDHHQHFHHSYWTHLPVCWLIVFLLWIFYGQARKSAGCIQCAQIAGLNVLVHLILDSVAGRIRWFAPLSSYGMSIVDIPSIYDWWVWNYLLHWSFGIELLIIGLALYILITRKLTINKGEKITFHSCLLINNRSKNNELTPLK